MKKIATPASKPWVKVNYLLSAFFSLISAGLLAMNPPFSDNRVVAMSPGLLFSETTALDGGDNALVSVPDSVSFVKVDELPLYKGGHYSGAVDYIKKNLKYPPIAIEKRVQGAVYVAFEVDESGSVQNPRLKNFRGFVLDSGNFVSRISTTDGNIPDPLKDAVSALEQEALRVVGSLEGFSPGKKDGKPVVVPFLFPVRFELFNPAKYTSKDSQLFNPAKYTSKDSQPSSPARMIDF